MACFAYDAAMRDGMLPRKPMPKDEPAAADKKPQAAPARPTPAPPHAP